MNRVRQRRLSEDRPARVRDRFGLGADIRWKPAAPEKMPVNARIVLHELRKWAATGRPFQNYRDLAQACDMSVADTKKACAFLDDKGLLDDRREPT